MSLETSDSQQSLQGMIFAAGLGTRFKPWTDHHPKALAMVHGKSLLQRNVEYLQTIGIFDVVVNVHHFAAQIIEAVAVAEGWGSRITISDESEEVLETGGGLLKAAPLLHAETILIMNADILTDLALSQMLSFHREHNNLATLAVSDRKTSRYFLFDEQHHLCGWKNIQSGVERISRPSSTHTLKAFSGIQIIERSLIDMITQRGKFSMVDVYLELAKTHPIGCFDHTGSKFLDVGKPDSVEQAELMWSF